MCLENTGGVSWCSYLKDQESVTRSLTPAPRTRVEWWRPSKFVPVANLCGWYPVFLQQNLTTNSHNIAGDNEWECPDAPGGTCPRVLLHLWEDRSDPNTCKAFGSSLTGEWRSAVRFVPQWVSTVSFFLFRSCECNPPSHQSGLEITQGEKSGVRPNQTVSRSNTLLIAYTSLFTIVKSNIKR